MKSLKFVVIALFLPFAFACTEETLAPEASSDDLVQLRDRDVRTVPYKFTMEIFSDASSDAVVVTCVGLPTYRDGFTSGRSTHTGQFRTEESTWTLIGCEPVSETVVIFYVDGIMAAANGDTYSYTGAFTSDLGTGEVYGEVDITGGTGRFEGVTGYVDCIGKSELDLTQFPLFFRTKFTGEGYLQYDK